MIPIDATIRKAWRPDNPLSLHHAAEKLAADGCDETEIYDALERLLLEERNRGASDEDEEKITNVMDRLTGWVHEANHIKTARTGPPTEQELAAIPRWAQVAFAARGARRTLPVFRLKWPDAPPHFHAKLAAAIEICEAAAAVGGSGADRVDYVRTAVLAAYVSDAAINSVRDRGRAIEVVNATIAVYTKLKDIPVDAIGSVVAAVAAGVWNASIAIANGIATGPEAYDAASRFTDAVIRADFARLIEFVRRQPWSDEMSVPPDIFGPLWPDGPPPGWPHEPNQPLSSGAASVARPPVGDVVPVEPS